MKPTNGHTHRVGQNSGAVSKVYNCCTRWRERAICVSKCSVLYGVRLVCLKYIAVEYSLDKSRETILC